ncbi:hypothetical protein Thini_3515 [Thiothrix nivea DSM 5205]|uniref:DUF11 domain-containing protein n=2 Tax=Thiothrix nivea TaxID=1031 RepID=A0A656HLY2_THINJ|nr:hypothetical protein Thini_3515 [Thiothrix nivea DSM 5205]
MNNMGILQPHKSVLKWLPIFFLFFCTATAHAQLTLHKSATLAELQAALQGPGLTLSNIKITKGLTGHQYGTFNGGLDSAGKGPVIGIPDGIFMTTGSLTSLLGPNSVPDYSGVTPDPPYVDQDLVSISPYAKFDPVIIEFDLIPTGDTLNFVLSFGSEEYPEYVCSQFNDGFGLFVSGPGFSTRNAAFIPGTSDAITINHVNNGTAGIRADGTACTLGNSAYFNDNGNGSGNANLQLDGFTKPITAPLAGLTAGETYHVKLALADSGDGNYDSGTFFKWLNSTDSHPVDLELTTVASNMAPVKNGTVAITYTLTNTSTTSDVEQVQTLLEWPAGISILNQDGEGSYNPATHVWSTGPIGALASTSITFNVQIGQEASYTASAEILYSDHEDPDSTPFNKATFPNEDDTASVTLTPSEAPHVTLKVRGLLQGPYDNASGLMQDKLRQQGLLPQTQPYALLGHNGTEMLSPAVAALEDNDAPTDWVLLELREQTNPAIRVAASVALIQRDGDVAEPQTNETTLHIPNVEEGRYYVTLRHRNHLGIMTATPLQLSNTATTVDFTLPETAVSGKHSRLLESHAALLWAGDVNSNNSVIASGSGNDLNAILGAILSHPENILGNSNLRLKGYLDGDLNMDGMNIYSGPDNDVNLLRANVLQYPDNGNGAANYIINGSLPE